ncbi:hypothetical protein [Halobellus salinisoli]|uniref:hypothetical protein n=1 Tax=Halobellus salinisoli TaxID=3108500 RepID=UPI003008FA77
MSRTLDVSGDSLGRLLSVLQLAALLAALFFVALPLDSPASVLLAVAFGSLAIATVVGLWRGERDADGGSHLDTAEDITYDPFADPGQAAKDTWKKAVRRLPRRHDER